MAVIKTEDNNNIVQYVFEIQGVELNNFPLSNIQLTTDTIKFTHSRTWNLQISTIGANGRVELTLQQSPDSLYWDDLANATEVRLEANQSISFEDTYFSGLYFRIIIRPTTLSSGNIKAILTQKS